LFAQYQPAYAEHGISTFPCSTDAKRPVVKNYLKIGLNGSKALAAEFTAHNAFGVACGRRNNLTVLDIDATEERVRDDAFARYGEPRVVVRTASGKWHGYYRYNGEPRSIRPQPDIDILGGGFVMAPPSLFGAGSYQIIHGRIEDFANLTTMRVDLPPPTTVAIPKNPIETRPGTEGRRNNDLWRYCMAAARGCNSLEELIDIAKGENAMYQPPLRHQGGPLSMELRRVGAELHRPTLCMGRGRRNRPAHIPPLRTIPPNVPPGEQCTQLEGIHGR
jgi:hypothetical protein